MVSRWEGSMPRARGSRRYPQASREFHRSSTRLAAGGVRLYDGPDFNVLAPPGSPGYVRTPRILSRP